MAKLKTLCARTLLGVLLAGFVLIPTLHTAALVHAEQSCIPSWQIINSPYVNGTSSGLEAIAVAAPNDIWAGGSFDQEGDPDSHTLLEHWDGAQWTIVDTPDVGRVRDFFVASPDDVWALGSAFKPNTQYLLHWDGNTWHKVASDIHARSIGGTSGTDVWQIEYPWATRHWDGTSWNAASGPPPSGIAEPLWDMKAFTPNDAWGVGSYRINAAIHGGIIVHWDGTEWTYRGSPSDDLLALDGVSSSDLWVAGSPNTPTTKNYLYHWDGQGWTRYRAPKPGNLYAVFTGLAAVSQNDVWAVGHTYTSPTTEERILMEHWNGKRWSPVAAPSLGITSPDLWKIAAVNTEDVWAVGTQKKDGKFQPLIMHATRPCYLPPAPKLRQPQDNANILLSPLQLVWKNSATATRYEIQMRRDGETGPVILRAPTTQRKYRFTKILDTGHYLWRVRGCNGGGCGAWSPYSSFDVFRP